MWKRIKETQYFLSFSQESGYEICVTDFLNVWTTMFSEKAFLVQLKESNDGLELPHDKEFVSKGIHLLSNIDNLKKCSIEKKETGKSLFITMIVSFGFPFYLECTLSKGSEELYFQKVTRPLLKIICDLRESQSELRHLLIKKDTEIAEYKSEGEEIVLRSLKTRAFNDAEHMKKHRVYEDYFGAPASILEDAINILEKNILKQAPNETSNQDPAPSIKTEPTAIVKSEPVSTAMEPDTTITTESILPIKLEPKEEFSEDTNLPVITASVNCKQEIKKEHARAHVPRKRSKFNF